MLTPGLRVRLITVLSRSSDPLDPGLWKEEDCVGFLLVAGDDELEHVRLVCLHVIVAHGVPGDHHDLPRHKVPSLAIVPGGNIT